MSAFQSHIRIPDANEACAFCSKQHTKRVQVWDNSGKYTRSWYIIFCDEHENDGEAKKREIEARRYVGNMWD